MSLSVTNPSYDRVYPMYAWRDNNVRLVLTQGEGATTLDGTAARIKAPRFQLRDDQEVMNLNGSPVINLALTRPDKSEDLLACTIIDATNGIISCPITASATAIAGQAVGEIRLSSTNGTIKFFGVHALIYDGVSNSAAAQSTQFSALVDALQKVATVNPDGSNTVTLDSAIVENGTNPVASGVIYAALQVLDNAKIDKDKAVKYTGSNDLSECVDNGVLYRVHDGTTYQILLCNSGDAYRVQYMFKRSGEVVFRTSAKSNDTWGAWSAWSPIGTTSNIADGAVTTAKIADDLAAVINTKEVKSNKKTTLTGNESSNNYYPTTKAVADYLTANYESLSNKLTSQTGINSDSTDTEYPTAKAVFDFGADILDEVAGDLVLKENLSNKKTTITGNETSEQYYPTTKAVADALSTKAPASTAYTFDSTTTNVVYDANNPKKIYTNAYVNGKSAFVLTTADNYYQIALCYDGSKYTRQLTGSGSTTYNPWLEVQNKAIAEEVGDLKSEIDEIELTQVPYEVDEKTDISAQLTLESNSAYLKPDLTTSPSNIWSYYSIAVARGDAFIIQTVAGLAAFPWIITDSDNQVIAKAEYEETVALTNIKIVASESGTLYINSRHQTTSDTITVYRGVVGNGTSQLRTDVNQLQSDVEQTQLDIDDLETSVSQLSFNTEKQTVEYTITNNYYSTGARVGATAGETGPFNNWKYATFPVTFGDKFEITSNAGQNARLYKIVDANNNILEVDSFSSIPQIRTVTVEVTQNSATAIIVNCQPKTPVSAPVVYKLVKTLYYPSEKVIIENQPLDDYLESLAISHSDNPLWGKKLCCCGDSITAGADMDAEGISQTSPITVYKWDNVFDTWSEVSSDFVKTYGYQIAEHNNMIYYQDGISGSTMQGIVANHGFSLENGRYTKLPDDIDYLTIWFGWNDNAYGTLGAIDDSTNESYYGGYNVVLPYLINKYPYTKIILIVPYGTNVEHRNAVRQLGNKWGLAVFDMFQGGTPLYYEKESSVGVNSSIVASNRAKFQAVGAHPNYKGHRQIGNMLEHFIRGC